MQPSSNHTVTFVTTAAQEEPEAGGGLIVKLDKGRAGAAGDPQALAAQWFSQPLFAGLDLAAASGSYPGTCAHGHKPGPEPCS